MVGHQRTLKGNDNMRNRQKDYNTKNIKKRILMILSLALLAGMIWLNATYDPWPEPDAVFPMANRNIEWTYAKGVVKDD